MYIVHLLFCIRRVFEQKISRSIYLYIHDVTKDVL